jgi:hypothetical protein
MVDCKRHGMSESLFRCLHVEVSPDGGLTREIEANIFDWTGTGFLVCASCVAPVRQFLAARTDEEREASSFVYRLTCLGCLDDALQETKHGSFAGLKRALGTPER